MYAFIVLTKRGERLAELSPQIDWPENVWMGVSVENQDCVSRIDWMRRTGARIKFLSLESLLGPIHQLDLTGINWAIAGGESGPGAPLKAVPGMKCRRISARENNQVKELSEEPALGRFRGDD
jgi:protein gp37